MKTSKSYKLLLSRKINNVPWVCRLTDVKGDMILLNPHIPSINLSKMAFSYGLGRAAKLTSIETMLDTYLKQFDQLPLLHRQVPQLLSKKNLKAQLLTIRQRIIRGSQDGFLGTADFQWTRLELQGNILYIRHYPPPILIYNSCRIRGEDFVSV